MQIKNKYFFNKFMPFFLFLVDLLNKNLNNS